MLLILETCDCLGQCQWFLSVFTKHHWHFYFICFWLGQKKKFLILLFGSHKTNVCVPPPPDAFSDGWQRCCHFCHSRPGKWKSAGDHEADFQCDRQEGSQHGKEEGMEFSTCNLINVRGFNFLANAPLFFFETTLSLQLYAGKTKELQQKFLHEWKMFSLFFRQSVSVLSRFVLHLLCSYCHSICKVIYLWPDPPSLIKTTDS